MARDRIMVDASRPPSVFECASAKKNVNFPHFPHFPFFFEFLIFIHTCSIMDINIYLSNYISVDRVGIYTLASSTSLLQKKKNIIPENCNR